jgi:hypothetical protein
MSGAAGRENPSRSLRSSRQRSARDDQSLPELTPSRIADIGGGANPMLAPAFIASAGIG